MITAAAFAYCQLGLHITTETRIDGNAYSNYEQISDIIYMPGISLDYSVAGEKSTTRVFYNCAASLFSEYSNRQFYLHRIGINGLYRTSDTAPLVSWGLQGGGRFNRDVYAYYNYRNIDAYVHVSLDGSETHTLVYGARYSYRSYLELPEFSYADVNGFIRASLYLKTRSTVIWYIRGGLKNYLQPEINRTSLIDDFTEGRGNGYGRNSHGSGNSNDSTNPRNITVTASGDMVFQVYTSLRVAQSLGEKTGAALELAIQRNPSGDGRFLSGQDSGYETNDDLYDDPYSYEMDELSGEINRLLPFGARLHLGAAYAVKQYQRGAYNLEGSLLEESRRDNVSTAWAMIRKIFPVGGNITSIGIYLRYFYIENESNDLYYNYSNSVFSAGLDLSI